MVHTVWLPMLKSDKRPAWTEKKIPISGDRVSHYWDKKRVIGKQYGKFNVQQNVVSWDIFFLYPEGTQFDSLFQPWSSMGYPIMRETEKLTTDFLSMIQNK